MFDQKGRPKNAQAARAEYSRHARKLREKKLKTAKARAAMTRSAEQQIRKQSASLEDALLKSVVHFTAWEATRALARARSAEESSRHFGGMQAWPAKEKAASVTVTHGDWSSKGVYRIP